MIWIIIEVDKRRIIIKFNKLSRKINIKNINILNNNKITTTTMIISATAHTHSACHNHPNNNNSNFSQPYK